MTQIELQASWAASSVEGDPAVNMWAEAHSLLTEKAKALGRLVTGQEQE